MIILNNIFFFSEHIDFVYPYTICIQGNNVNNNFGQWQFDDGTAMMYFNWYFGEPSKDGYIRLVRQYEYKWYATCKIEWFPCSFICEYRYY